MVPSSNANCEADVDKFICILELLNLLFPHLFLSLCTISANGADEGLTNQEVNTLAYIAGYIVRKISQKVCTSCKGKIVGELDADNRNHDFLSAKSYGFSQHVATYCWGLLSC